MDRETERLIRDLIEVAGDGDCRIDHEGSCQEHYWFGHGACPVPRAKRYLEERGGQT